MKDGVKVTVPLGAPYIFKDEVMIQNDTESVAVKQRIYLPIRVVIEAFGAKVDYDYKAGMVVISTSKDSGNTEKPDIKKPDNSAGQEMRAMWISYLEFNVVPKNRRRTCAWTAWGQYNGFLQTVQCEDSGSTGNPGTAPLTPIKLSSTEI